jgi:NTE family protein
MRALVLSGGAVKGAYQVGVLKRWMGDQGLDYDIMCGVSVGSLNVAGLALTPFGHPEVAIKFLEDFWLSKVNTAAIYKRWFPFGRLHALWLKSVFNSSPLIDLVKSNMHLEKIASNGRQLAVGAVCLDTGEERYARETEPNFIDWVLASASYPVFLNPIKIEGKWWSDGGIRHVTPLGQAIRMGATEIDVVMCSNFKNTDFDAENASAVPDLVVRMLDLMSAQIIRNDIEQCGLKNELAEINPKYKKVTVRVVMPENDLVKNSLEFDPADVRRMIDLGYHDADLAVNWT